jgi:hypothetical protein
VALFIGQPIRAIDILAGKNNVYFLKQEERTHDLKPIVIGVLLLAGSTLEAIPRAAVLSTS